MAKDKTWDVVLRVPTKNVGDVADRIRNGQVAVVESYDKQLADNFGVEGTIAVVAVVERPRSVVVTVQGPDIRVNVVSKALEAVVGYDLGVSFPSWG